MTWVEPGFPETALGQVRQAVGHQFQIAPEIGAATGIYVAPDQTLTAVAGERVTFLREKDVEDQAAH